MKQGTITLTPSAVIKNFKPEALAVDPSGLAEKAIARTWFNTTDKKLKYFDGTEIHTLAVGGNLEDYLKLDGSVAMSGDLPLSSSDQSSSANEAAISKGHLDNALSLKQDNVTGAATTILTENVAAEKVLVSDVNGKVSESTVTTAELAHLTGLTETVVSALDKKEDTLGYVPLDVAGSNAMTSDLSLGGNRATGLSKGVQANDAVTLSQLENAVAGLDFQKDVNAIQVDATLDVTSATEGDRYVITDIVNLDASFGTIANLESNDIVEFDGTEWVVAYDVSEKGEGALVWNIATGEFWRFDAAWEKFGGLSGVTAGLGLSKDGDTINVNFGAGVEANNDLVTVAVYSSGALQLVDPSTGELSSNPDAVLAVKIEGDSLEVTVNGVRVKANGITNSMINADVVGNGLHGGEGSALSVKASDSSVVVDVDGVKLNEVHTDGIYARQDGADFTTPIGVVAAVDADHAMPKSQIESTINALAGDKVNALAERFVGSYFEFTADAPALSFTIPHNLGTKAVQVVCYDEVDDQFIPNSVTTTDENTVTITVADAMTIRVAVQGLKVVS